MAEWRDRGVNTIFTVNGGGNYITWTNEAMKQGLYIVRAPAGVDDKYRVIDRAAFEQDVRNPFLLAIALVDEPSNLKPGGAGITYYDVMVPPAEVDVAAQELSGGGKPLWINHIGAHINNVYLEKIMSDYADSPYIDWLAQDSYPVASGWDLVLDLDDYTSTPQGHSIDRLLRWSGGRPQFSFLGVTKYNADVGRDTTPEEFRLQAWSSIIHGATGLIYFSFMFSPQFSYDATPENLVAEIKMLHAQIDEIEPILMDKDKGGRRPWVLLKSVHGEANDPTSLPYPFEACSIKTDRGEYKIILNLANEPAELTYEPWGLAKVSFSPYQCKRGYSAKEIM
ncbi:hypothetical protein [Rhizobium sp. IBUN]|uniref:hypothetical protein n=1 Tax=Rhizobium sp. IBUN TaxID=1042326 RepID=UPI000414837C|nr:hypothetical protein [Rhizobium sp. IBUN]